MYRKLTACAAAISIALSSLLFSGCAAQDPAAQANQNKPASVEQEIKGWETVEAPEEETAAPEEAPAAEETAPAEETAAEPAEPAAEETPAETGAAAAAEAAAETAAPTEEDYSALGHVPPSKEPVDQESIVMIDIESGIEETVRVLPVDDPAPEPVEEIAATEHAPQIVVFGDSQFGNFRTETGMAYLIAQYCHANIYNCAQGGTTASMDKDDQLDPSNWTSRSFVGMCYIATGQVSPEFVKPYSESAYTFLSTCDFSKTDYFIIEYGVNDYLSKHPLSKPENLYDPYTYGGALRMGIGMLQEAFPNAKIIVCTPSYAQFFSASNGGYLGDGNILSNGLGTLRDYVDVCGNAAGSIPVDVINAYDWLDIWSVNASEYLLDGVHLNENGRRRYALLLSRFILRDMGYQFSQGQVEVYYLDWKLLDEELKSLPFG